jgi:uncharacterized membrane protein YfcA
MNKKTLKIIGAAAVIIGTIALYLSGSTETEIVGIVSGVVVVLIAVIAIFHNEIGKWAKTMKEKIEAINRR